MSVREEERGVRRKTVLRIQGLFVAAVLATTTIIVRLGYMQINQNALFNAQVNVQNYDTLTIPGPRGWIFDREGQVLAADKPVFDIIYIRYPNDQQSAAGVAQRLAPILRMKPKGLLNELLNVNPEYAMVTLAQNASPMQVSYVAEHRNSLPGVTIITVPMRVYPQGYVGAHEIGFIGPIPKNQANYYINTLHYSYNAQVGLSGLEQQYQTVLRGRPGAEQIPISSQGIALNQQAKIIPSQAGHNLILNMNGYLEKVAEQALIYRIQYLRNRGETNVDSGTVVVMNVHTGAVLAMASYPSYQPSWWVGGISEAHYAKYLTNNAGENRAISGLYMPGSTQKPLTAMAALMNHEMTPSLKVDDLGGLQIGNYYMRSWNPVGFGWIGLRHALEVSDDTYFYQVGLDMGHYNPNMPASKLNWWLNGPRVQALKQIQNMGKEFGLTVNTGIDLPGENPGYVTFANPPTLYDLPAAAIGQEEAYSTIGMVDYIAAIANGGYRMQPQMVHEITTPTGKVVKVFHPHVVDKVNVKPEYLKLMQQGLEMATHGSLGTATYFFGNDPVNVAGKTGTAESGIPGRNNSVFIGYAPYNNPQIAIAAVIPNVTGEGFHAAAPMAQTIIDAYFRERGKHWTIAMAH